MDDGPSGRRDQVDNLAVGGHAIMAGGDDSAWPDLVLVCGIIQERPGVAGLVYSVEVRCDIHFRHLEPFSTPSGSGQPEFSAKGGKRLMPLLQLPAAGELQGMACADRRGDLGDCRRAMGGSAPTEYVWLASTWDIPAFEINEETSVPCWRWLDETNWTGDTYWPESALAILRGAAPEKLNPAGRHPEPPELIISHPARGEGRGSRSRVGDTGRHLPPGLALFSRQQPGIRTALHSPSAESGHARAAARAIRGEPRAN